MFTDPDRQTTLFALFYRGDSRGGTTAVRVKDTSDAELARAKARYNRDGFCYANSKQEAEEAAARGETLEWFDWMDEQAAKGELSLPADEDFDGFALVHHWFPLEETDYAYGFSAEVNGVATDVIIHADDLKFEETATIEDWKAVQRTRVVRLEILHVNVAERPYDAEDEDAHGWARTHSVEFGDKGRVRRWDDDAFGFVVML